MTDTEDGLLARLKPFASRRYGEIVVTTFVDDHETFGFTFGIQAMHVPSGARSLLAHRKSYDLPVYVTFHDRLFMTVTAYFSPDFPELWPMEIITGEPVAHPNIVQPLRRARES